MKLNHECMREVLLEIEKIHRVFVNENDSVEKEFLTIHALYKALPQYGKEEIFYCLFNLEQAGYVSLSTQWISGSVYNCSINHMTYAGHEFLDKIRDPQRWTFIKKGLSAVRNYSLAAISAVAEGATTAAINKYISGGKS